jgi:hypothetical protein
MKTQTPAPKRSGANSPPRSKSVNPKPANGSPPAAAPAPPPAVEAKTTAGELPKGKLGIMVALLTRPEGATVAQMSTATGWQAHSVRGAMSGALKKDRNYLIASTPTEAGRVYRIGEAGEPA